MTAAEITARPALVTGASRGFGRATATALAASGAPVTGVARGRGALDDLRAELGSSFTPVAADAADPVVAGRLIDACRPACWCSARAPSRWPARSSGTPGRRSAGTGTWTCRTSSTGPARHGLGIRFVSLLPQLTPVTRLGEAAVSAYAAREGIEVAAFTERAGPPLAAEPVAKTVLDLAAGDESGQDAYLLTAAGLSPAP